MQKKDKVKFLEVLTSLSDLYDAPLSQGSISLYWETLKVLPLDGFIAASKHHAETSKWMPKPSDFLDAARKGSMSLEERSAMAWLGVVSAVRSVGANRGVNFDDPLIHATIRSLGGWANLCRSKTQYFNSTVRAAFLKTYEHMSRCAENGTVLGTLGSLEPLYGAEKNSDMIDISTGLPQGPQHKMLREHVADRELNNGRLTKLIQGISKATEIDSTTQREPEQNAQGKKAGGQTLERTTGDDRAQGSEESR
jgi:hypothetical protein